MLHADPSRPGWGKNSAYRHGIQGQKGDDGERIVEQYFDEHGISYTALTDRYSQATLKIDYHIGESNTPMDVKTNIFKGYLAVELHNSKGGLGWLHTSTAEVIYAVDRDYHLIYTYGMDDMKAHVAHIMSRGKKAKQAKNGAYLVWISVNTPFIKHLK